MGKRNFRIGAWGALASLLLFFLCTSFGLCAEPAKPVPPCHAQSHTSDSTKDICECPLSYQVWEEVGSTSKHLTFLKSVPLGYFSPMSSLISPDPLPNFWNLSLKRQPTVPSPFLKTIKLLN